MKISEGMLQTEILSELIENNFQLVYYFIFTSSLKNLVAVYEIRDQN